MGVLCDYDLHEVNSHVTRLFLFLVHHIPHTPPPPTLPYRSLSMGTGEHRVTALHLMRSLSENAQHVKRGLVM